LFHARRGQAAASGAGAGLWAALQQLDFLFLFHLRKKKRITKITRNSHPGKHAAIPRFPYNLNTLSR
ncbi:MAG: hypothetical protein AAGD28_31490, partial [Bacteroidota bacterium]